MATYQQRNAKGASTGHNRPPSGNANSTSDILRPIYKPSTSGSSAPSNRPGTSSGGGPATTQNQTTSNPSTSTPRPNKPSSGSGSGGSTTGAPSGGGPAPTQNSGPGYDSLGHPAYGDFAMGGGGGGGGGGRPAGAAAPAAPANPLGLTQPTVNPFTQMPWFSGQSPDWWSNTGHVAAANAWNGAMLPWYDWANNAANSQNTWNNNQWNQGWGAMSDVFGMGMDIANLQADYGQGLNNLDYNAWATGLESTGNALGTMGDLYGNLDRNYNEAYANMYGSDMGYLGNMANTQGQWDIANMQALNDWYNQQARNQTDLQVATMQAFGRQQAPNARFMQNWG